MKAEKPALGISRSSAYGDCEVYNIDCECDDPGHMVQMWIEVSPEKDINDVEVTFYVNTNFRWWENIWQRLKMAWNILFGRGYEQNHSMLLREQAALNFAAAIEQSIKDLQDENLRSDK